MEAGKFFIDSKMVDLSKVVPEEIELLKTLADSKKVKIKYIAPKSSIPKIMLDDDKTRQVIMNITENAIQYSPSKGGLVEISLQKDKNKVVFKVKDNGIGVPKDQQAKLFTKMFRASNAKEIRPDGTGLGLFLVKRVVEDQGGQEQSSEDERSHYLTEILAAFPRSKEWPTIKAIGYSLRISPPRERTLADNLSWLRRFAV